jgi:hypothetical protein
VLPIRDRAGNVHLRRACLDGPVLNGARIAWEDTRYGAPSAGVGAGEDAGEGGAA